MKLGELVDIIGGGTPSRKNAAYWNGDIPWISVKDFNTNKISSSLETITEEGLENSSAKLIPKGNIIVPTRMALGKVAINEIDVAINQDLKALMIKDLTLLKPQYLLYFLKSKSAYLQSLGKGATVKGITIESLTNLDIKVPALEIQEQVVTALNKCQTLITNRKQQIEALSSLKQSIFLDMFGDPITNEKKWSLKSLDALGTWQSGGTPRRKNKEYYKGNIPWLPSGELNDIYTYDSHEKITEIAIEESSAKLIPKNSLLLGMYDTAGLKSTINKVKCSCNQAIAFAHLDEKLVSTEFVYFTIQLMKDYLKTQQRGVRQKNFNLTMIKQIEIIMPPISLQTVFKQRLHEILKIETQMKESVRKFNSLFNSLSQKAFNGELFNNKVNI